MGSTLITNWLKISVLTEGALSPNDSVLRQTHELRRWVVTHPTQGMPDNLPGYLRVGDACWLLLRESMTSNANAYDLIVTKVVDTRMDSHNVHDLVEIYVDVDFYDGTLLEMYSM